MSATTFDTLAYAKKLQEAGFSSQQAETQAEALKDVIDDNLATKQDINELKKDIQQVRSEMQQFKGEVRGDMQLLEERISYKLTIRLGLMLLAAFTLFATVIKL